MSTIETIRHLISLQAETKRLELPDATLELAKDIYALMCLL